VPAAAGVRVEAAAVRAAVGASHTGAVVAVAVAVAVAVVPSLLPTHPERRSTTAVDPSGSNSS